MSDRTPQPHDKPAEIHTVDGSLTAQHVKRDGAWLLVWENGNELPAYYPRERIQRVVRLPHTNGQEPDTASAESESEPADSDPSDSYDPDARKKVRKIMAFEDLPIEEFGLVHDSKQVKISPSQEVDNDEGSPWREFTEDYFGNGKIGSIKWGEYERDDGTTGNYPEHFYLTYDAIDKLQEEVMP